MSQDRLPIGVHLGVDVGGKRTGVARCDDLGMLCAPLTTIHEEVPERIADAVMAIAREEGAVCLVVGVPLNGDGSENSASAKMRRFGELLLARGAPRVEFQDERLTSHAAERLLVAVGHTGRRRKARVDGGAATLILEAWLAKAHPRPATVQDEPPFAPVRRGQASRRDRAGPSRGGPSRGGPNRRHHEDDE